MKFFHNKRLADYFDCHLTAILLVFFSSYWFFSFWVLKNGGEVWIGPLAIPHHPYDMKVFDQEFWKSILYLFTQSPLYSILTWLMLKTDPSEGFAGYIFLHYIIGSYALICLYRLMTSLNIKPNFATLALMIFVFNPGFYYEFSVGWYDFLSMCLVSITAYHLSRVIQNFNTTNLVLALFFAILLVLYRSLFHPLLFLLPLIVGLALIYKEHWKKIVFLSVLPFSLTLAPYVKNYLIYDTFNVGIGSFAMANKTISFEYLNKEKFIEEINKHNLDPLMLCFSHILPVDYQGVHYDLEQCRKEILPSVFTATKINILNSRPFLKTPLILQEKNQVFGGSYIPNTIQGLLVAKAIIKNSTHYLTQHKEVYGQYITNSYSQYFRSINTYNNLIALNWRHLPEWFSYKILNLDFFKVRYPAFHQEHIDVGYRPLLVVTILSSLFYALWFAANLRYINLFSLLHFFALTYIFYPKPNHYICGTLCAWTFSFTIILSVIMIYKRLLSPCRHHYDAAVNTRNIIMLLSAFCIYNFILSVVLTGSEQERYRFPVDGIYLTIFLFWLTNTYSFLSNKFCNFLSDGSKKCPQ